MYAIDLSQIEQSVSVHEDAYSQGLRDGQRSMFRGSMSDNQYYRAGYKRGLQKYRSRIPQTTEQPLERGWHDELLNEV